MRTINRPTTETDVLNGAKDAINDAVAFLQRDHAYCYSEKLSTVTYPASTLQVDLGTYCGGVLRNLKSIQQVSADGLVQGKPIKIMAYDELQAMRRKYYRTHTSVEPYTLNDSLSGWTIEDAYSCDVIAFLVGQSLGIYPTPTSARYLLLNTNIWLPEMTATSDTNFFLTYAMDVVQMLALRKMSFYMKEDNRVAATDAEVVAAINSLVQWDSQVTNTAQSSMP